jgi:hypothetical protein
MNNITTRLEVTKTRLCSVTEIRDQNGVVNDGSCILTKNALVVVVMITIPILDAAIVVFSIFKDVELNYGVGMVIVKENER